MKPSKPKKQLLATIARGSALLGACALSAPLVQAKDFTYDNGFELNVDFTLGYAVAWRTQSANTEISQNINANDGTNAFDAGVNGLINSAFTGILEVGGVYKDFSFFVRGDALYDYVYANQKSDMSIENYQTFNNGIPNGGTVQRGDFPDDTIDNVGKRMRLLDAFISYQFDVGENMGGAFRLGRQVISWGEATFYSGVNAMQNPLDAVARTTPGSEVREYLLPTGAFDLKWDFTTSFSMEAYYKLWEKSTLPAVGSYWSTSDITGPGAERILLGPLGSAESGDTVEPGAGDHQYGVAARYVTEALGGANFDFYYVKANGNFPAVFINADFSGNSQLHEIYANDIDNYGMSFSTNVSEAQVYADITYSPNMPIVNTQQISVPGGLVVSDLDRAHLWQVAFGMTDLYTAFPWLSEQIVFTAEAIYTENNLGEHSDVNKTSYSASGSSWGYQFAGIFNYFAVIQGLDMNVTLFFKHDVDGNGNGIGYQGLTNNAKTLAISTTGYYLSNWEATLRYTTFWGGDDDQNLTHDRDNIALTAKYRF